MSPKLLTSIQLSDGQFDLLSEHQERINYSRWKLYQQSRPIDLKKALHHAQAPKKGLFKCRVIYSQDIERIQFVPYQVKSIKSLQLVEVNHLDYSYKYADRRQIEAAFQQRGSADDIIIVKDRQIRDSSYANLAFWDGKYWYTPHPPLLPGTRRQALLQQGIIKLRNIHLADLAQFQKLRLFNALIPWDKGPELPIEAILR